MSESSELNVIDPELLGQVKFDDKGLVPAITQNVRTGEILMQAFMNRESLEKTLETGHATYWSRSRAKLWMKGETSGHIQKVHQILIDCDQDSLILLVEQRGPACHTGEETCFYRTLAKRGSQDQGSGCAGCAGGGCCG
jgi:phosphoribosyl-AMP cyclohydrolase